MSRSMKVIAWTACDGSQRYAVETDSGRLMNHPSSSRLRWFRTREAAQRFVDALAYGIRRPSGVRP